MLEIAKSNSKTSNNNARLAIAVLIVNIAKLVAIALIIPIVAAPFKLTVGAFAFTSFRSRDLMSCDSTSPH